MAANNSNYIYSVYHIIPRDNGKVYWILRMGETKPLKTFKSEAAAKAYAAKRLMKDGKNKIYINSLKNHVRRYKNR